MIIKSLQTSLITEFCEWAQHYQRYNLYPCGTERRFTIATYQTMQGIVWEDGYHKQNIPNSDWESFASGALHFAMVASSLKLSILDSVKAGWPIDFTSWETNKINWRDYTVEHGKAAQMIIYGIRAKDPTKYQRGSRYSPEKLTLPLYNLVNMLLSHIPSANRKNAVEEASSIMSGRL